MNRRAPSSELPAPGGSRQERKQRTRQALVDSALALLEHESFGSLSLREVARGAGVVPTAFYRHFDSLEALGLVIVEESFRALRRVLREARAELAPERVIRRSVEILVRHVHAHRPYFRFVARERHSGVRELRLAIRTEIRLLSSELATDLARFPVLERWTTEDLQMLASLLVNAMVSTVEAILDAPMDSPEAEQEIVRTAERQLTVIALGIPHFRSGGRGWGAPA